MARAVILLVTVGVAIYAAVDCLRSRPEEIRLLPKLVWLLGIVVFPLAGALAYLTLGRVGVPISGRAGARAQRVVAPDDDPDFLRSLERRRREAEEKAKRDGEGDDLSGKPN
jgi:hypothetical protein